MGTDFLSKTSRAVFLDRDGVVIQNIYDGNDNVKSPKGVGEIIINSAIEEMIDNLNSKNINTIVVTNQPDISRKKVTLAELENIHNYLLNKLKITAIIYCPHDDHDNCNCRKPKTGMIELAKEMFHLNDSNCILIGDRNSDITCAVNSNIASIHVTNFDKCPCLANWHANLETKEINKIVSNFF
jgi:D-glycero-D-manno-heptose 1,7-bisphosphate phosphatase